MERMEGAVGHFFAEDFKSLILRRSSKCEETEVLVLACRNQLLQELVVGSIQFFFTLTFNLGIFSQSISCISKCHFQLHSTLTGLTAVRFVHNDRERFSSGITHQIIDDRKLLKGCDDDTLAVLHGFQ